MASIFTLKTNQSFNHNIKVEGSVEAREPVIVKGLVNGLRLEHERENTVMVRVVIKTLRKFLTKLLFSAPRTTRSCLLRQRSARRE